MSPEETRAVLRRAAELDALLQTAPDDHLDEDVVRQAAAEVGLSADNVERAVAELRSGRLVQAADLPTGRRAGLDAVVVLTHPTARTEAVEHWLSSQWFELRRRRGATSDWEPRGGLAAKARRATDLQKTLRLQDVRTLRVEPQGEGVRVTADLGDLRNGLIGGMVLVPAGVVGGLTAVLLGIGPETVLAAPAAIAAGGVGWAGARRTLTARRQQVQNTLQLMLDDPPAVRVRPGIAEISQLFRRRDRH